MVNSIIFSFYTKDKYYTKKAKELAESLDQLGLDYYLKAVEIPEGKEWPDICREKIGYIKEFYDANPTKKVFWIDVDCQLSYLPDLVKDFSADIIGFQRGFQVPLKIGYHYKKRFFEPCFVGFNRTEATEQFLQDACNMEQSFEGRATDDYFFEEAWRANSQFMSFQIIPSGFASIQGRKRKENMEPFFFFGSSGNVSKYVGSVIQHTTPWITDKCFELDIKKSAKGLVKKVLPNKVKYKVKMLLLKRKKLEDHIFKKKAFEYGKSGNNKSLVELIKSHGGYEYLTSKQLDIIKLANSFLYYKMNKNSKSTLPAIKLAWWHLPEPGNYGDWLSPYIINKITGGKIDFVNPQSKNIAGSHYFSIGSIGKFTKNNSIVLGTGISAKDAELNTNAKYLMVRGPYTRQRILELGGECPEVYGDPAVVLPKIYTPKISDENKNSEKLLLVRHFTNQDIKLNLPNNMDEISIFASHPKYIEKFIDTLHQYKGVVTSAMHCYITCQAYGIPCALVTFKGNTKSVHGDGMKYRDYLSGVDLEEHDPIEIPLNLSSYNFDEIISDKKIKTEIIDKVYEVMVKALKEDL